MRGGGRRHGKRTRAESFNRGRRASLLGFRARREAGDYSPARARLSVGLPHPSRARRRSSRPGTLLRLKPLDTLHDPRKRLLTLGEQCERLFE